jgi:two-component system sensor histidine kinase KdpD
MIQPRGEGRDPESFLRLIRRSRRGRLKVYLGYAAGVGKTYQMLLEGHRLREQGVDVVVGYVENHGRPDTQSLVLGLEEVPRRAVDYRGIRLEEMDLDAVLARRPEIVLVDELAHTNAPGGRHAKRWQDVLEILDAGISAITTVNVQHFESLYDTIGGLVGVTVKERVPDWVVAEADQVVNVDLTVEDLRQRLEEGKVYPQSRASAALTNFFQPENLEQLRELALREAAAQAQRPGGSRREGPALFAPDQVMVCLSSKGPAAAALLRFASRLAGRLDRNWYAVYVQTPHEEPERLDATTQRQIADTLELAQQLGAAVFTYRGDEVVGTILRFAREYGVGHVVVGRPGRRRWWDRLLGRRSPAHELLDRAEGLSVVVVDPAARATPAALPSLEEPRIAGRGTASGRVSLLDLVPPEAIFVLAGQPGKEEIIELLAERLGRLHPHLDAATARRRLLRREGEGSTFLASGVGLPHARIPGLPAPLAALALCPEATTDGAARVVVLLLFPEDDPQLALRLFADVARVFRRGQAIDALAAAADADEAVAVWRSVVQAEDRAAEHRAGQAPQENP